VDVGELGQAFERVVGILCSADAQVKRIRLLILEVSSAVSTRTALLGDVRFAILCPVVTTGLKSDKLTGHNAVVLAY
jgi:hypothetical protein